MRHSRQYYRLRALVRVVFWLSLFALLVFISCGLWWNGHGYTVTLNPLKGL